MLSIHIDFAFTAAFTLVFSFAVGFGAWRFIRRAPDRRARQQASRQDDSDTP
jgi:hypothetical protein